MMRVASTMEEQDGETVVKRLSVPVGLEELMTDLTKEVLQKRPSDVYSFASEHFAHLLALRDNGNYQKGPTKAITYLTKGNGMVNGKIRLDKPSSGGSAKHLPRQVSIRVPSPTKKPGSTSRAKRSGTPKFDGNNNGGKSKDKKENKPAPKRQTPGSKNKTNQLDPVKEDAFKVVAKRQGLSRRSTEKRDKNSMGSRDSKRSSSEDSEKSRRRSTEKMSPVKNVVDKKEKPDNSREVKKKEVKETAVPQRENSGTFIPKNSSTEEDSTYIKDGRLTVSPPKIIKEAQTSPDSSDVPTSLVVPVLAVASGCLQGKDKCDQKSLDFQSSVSGEQTTEDRSIGEANESEDRKNDSETGEVLNSFREELQDNSACGKYDPSALREELQKVEEEAKLSNFTTSYNPYKLRQEIKGVSAEEGDELEKSKERPSRPESCKLRLMHEQTAFSQETMETGEETNTINDKASAGPSPPVDSHLALQHTGELHDLVVPKEGSEEDSTEDKKDKPEVMKEDASKAAANPSSGLNSERLQHSGELHDLLVPQKSCEGSALNDEKNKTAAVNEDLKNTTIGSSPRLISVELQHSGELHDVVIPKGGNEDGLTEDKKLTNEVETSIKENEEPASGVQNREEIHDTVIPESKGGNNNVKDKLDGEDLERIKSTNDESRQPAPESVLNQGKGDVNHTSLEDNLINHVQEEANVEEANKPFSSEKEVSIASAMLASTAAAATKIQSFWRGFKVRKSRKPKLDELLEQNKAGTSVDKQASNKHATVVQGDSPTEDDSAISGLTNEELEEALVKLDNLSVPRESSDSDGHNQPTPVGSPAESPTNTDAIDILKNEYKIPEVKTQEDTLANAPRRQSVQKLQGEEPDKSVLTNSISITDSAISRSLDEGEEKLQQSCKNIEILEEHTEDLGIGSEKSITHKPESIDKLADQPKVGNTVAPALNLKSEEASLEHTIEVHDSLIPKYPERVQEMLAGDNNPEDLAGKLEAKTTENKKLVSTLQNIEQPIEELDQKPLQLPGDTTKDPVVSNELPQLALTAGLQHSGELHDLLIPKQVSESIQELKDNDSKTTDLRQSEESHDLLVPKEIDQTDQKPQDSNAPSLQHSGELHDLLIPEEADEISQGMQDHKRLRATSHPENVETDLFLLKEADDNNQELKIEKLQVGAGPSHKEDLEMGKTLVETNLHHSGELHDPLVLKQSEEKIQNQDVLATSNHKRSDESLVPKETEELSQQPKQDQKLIAASPKQTETEESSQMTEKDKHLSRTNLQHSSEMHDILIPKDTEENDEQKQDVDISGLEHTGELHDYLIPKESVAQDNKILRDTVEEPPVEKTESLKRNQENPTEGAASDEKGAKEDLDQQSTLVLDQGDANEPTELLKELSAPKSAHGLQHSGELHDLILPQNEMSLQLEANQNAPDTKDKKSDAETTENKLSKSTLAPLKASLKPVAAPGLEHSGELHDLVLPESSNMATDSISQKSELFTDGTTKDNYGEESNNITPIAVQDLEEVVTSHSTEKRSSPDDQKEVEVALPTAEKEIQEPSLGSLHTGGLHDSVIPRPGTGDSHERIAQKEQSPDERKLLTPNQVQNVGKVAKVELIGNENNLYQQSEPSVLDKQQELHAASAAGRAKENFSASGAPNLQHNRQLIPINTADKETDDQPADSDIRLSTLDQNSTLEPLNQDVDREPLKPDAVKIPLATPSTLSEHSSPTKPADFENMHDSLKAEEAVDDDQTSTNKYNCKDRGRQDGDQLEAKEVIDEEGLSLKGNAYLKPSETSGSLKIKEFKEGVEKDASKIISSDAEGADNTMKDNVGEAKTTVGEEQGHTDADPTNKQKSANRKFKKRLEKDHSEADIAGDSGSTEKSSNSGLHSELENAEEGKRHELDISDTKQSVHKLPQVQSPDKQTLEELKDQIDSPESKQDSVSAGKLLQETNHYETPKDIQPHDETETETKTDQIKISLDAASKAPKISDNDEQSGNIGKLIEAKITNRPISDTARKITEETDKVKGESSFPDKGEDTLNESAPNSGIKGSMKPHRGFKEAKSGKTVMEESKNAQKGEKLTGAEENPVILSHIYDKAEKLLLENGEERKEGKVQDIIGLHPEVNKLEAQKVEEGDVPHTASSEIHGDPKDKQSLSRAKHITNNQSKQTNSQDLFQENVKDSKLEESNIKATDDQHHIPPYITKTDSESRDTEKRLEQLKAPIKLEDRSNTEIKLEDDEKPKVEEVDKHGKIHLELPITEKLQQQIKGAANVEKHKELQKHEELGITAKGNHNEADKENSHVEDPEKGEGELDKEENEQAEKEVHEEKKQLKEAVRGTQNMKSENEEQAEQPNREAEDSKIGRAITGILQADKSIILGSSEAIKDKNTTSTQENKIVGSKQGNKQILVEANVPGSSDSEILRSDNNKIEEAAVESFVEAIKENTLEITEASLKLEEEKKKAEMNKKGSADDLRRTERNTSKIEISDVDSKIKEADLHLKLVETDKEVKKLSDNPTDSAAAHKEGSDVSEKTDEKIQSILNDTSRFLDEERVVSSLSLHTNENRNQLQNGEMPESKNKEQQEIVDVPTPESHLNASVNSSLSAPARKSENSLTDESASSAYKFAPAVPATSDTMPNIIPNENIQIPPENIHKQARTVDLKQNSSKEIIKPDVEILEGKGSDENLTLAVQKSDNDENLQKSITKKEITEPPSNEILSLNKKSAGVPKTRLLFQHSDDSQDKELDQDQVDNAEKDINVLKSEEERERPLSINSTTSADSVATVIFNAASPHDELKGSLERSLSNSSEKLEDHRHDAEKNEPKDPTITKEEDSPQTGTVSDTKREENDYRAKCKDVTASNFDPLKLHSEIEEAARVSGDIADSRSSESCKEAQTLRKIESEIVSEEEARLESPSEPSIDVTVNNKSLQHGNVDRGDLTSTGNSETEAVEEQLEKESQEDDVTAKQKVADLKSKGKHSHDSLSIQSSTDNTLNSNATSSIAVKQERESGSLRQAAATTIQSSYRGYRIRRDLQHQRSQKHEKETKRYSLDIAKPTISTDGDARIKKVLLEDTNSKIEDKYVKTNEEDVIRKHSLENEVQIAEEITGRHSATDHGLEIKKSGVDIENEVKTVVDKKVTDKHSATSRDVNLEKVTTEIVNKNKSHKEEEEIIKHSAASHGQVTNIHTPEAKTENDIEGDTEVTDKLSASSKGADIHASRETDGPKQEENTEIVDKHPLTKDDLDDILKKKISDESQAKQNKKIANKHSEMLETEISDQHKEEKEGKEKFLVINHNIDTDAPKVELIDPMKSKDDREIANRHSEVSQSSDVQPSEKTGNKDITRVVSKLSAISRDIDIHTGKVENVDESKAEEDNDFASKHSAKNQDSHIQTYEAGTANQDQPELKNEIANKSLETSCDSDIEIAKVEAANAYQCKEDKKVSAKSHHLDIQAAKGENAEKDEDENDKGIADKKSARSQDSDTHTPETTPANKDQPEQVKEIEDERSTGNDSDIQVPKVETANKDESKEDEKADIKLSSTRRDVRVHAVDAEKDEAEEHKDEANKHSAESQDSDAQTIQEQIVNEGQSELVKGSVDRNSVSSSNSDVRAPKLEAVNEGEPKDDKKIVIKLSETSRDVSIHTPKAENEDKGKTEKDKDVANKNSKESKNSDTQIRKADEDQHELDKEILDKSTTSSSSDMRSLKAETANEDHPKQNEKAGENGSATSRDFDIHTGEMENADKNRADTGGDVVDGHAGKSQDSNAETPETQTTNEDSAEQEKLIANKLSAICAAEMENAEKDEAEESKEVANKHSAKSQKLHASTLEAKAANEGQSPQDKQISYELSATRSGPDNRTPKAETVTEEQSKENKKVADKLSATRSDVDSHKVKVENEDKDEAKEHKNLSDKYSARRDLHVRAVEAETANENQYEQDKQMPNEYSVAHIQTPNVETENENQLKDKQMSGSHSARSSSSGIHISKSKEGEDTDKHSEVNNSLIIQIARTETANGHKSKEDKESMDKHSAKNHSLGISTLKAENENTETKEHKKVTGMDSQNISISVEDKPGKGNEFTAERSSLRLDSEIQTPKADTANKDKSEEQHVSHKHSESSYCSDTQTPKMETENEDETQKDKQLASKTSSKSFRSDENKTEKNKQVTGESPVLNHTSDRQPLKPETENEDQLKIEEEVVSKEQSSASYTSNFPVSTAKIEAKIEETAGGQQSTASYNLNVSSPEKEQERAKSNTPLETSFAKQEESKDEDKDERTAITLLDSKPGHARDKSKEHGLQELLKSNNHSRKSSANSKTRESDEDKSVVHDPYKNATAPPLALLNHEDDHHLHTTSTNAKDTGEEKQTPACEETRIDAVVNKLSLPIQSEDREQSLTSDNQQLAHVKTESASCFAKSDTKATETGKPITEEKNTGMLDSGDSPKGVFPQLASGSTQQHQFSTKTDTGRSLASHNFQAIEERDKSVLKGISSDSAPETGNDSDSLISPRFHTDRQGSVTDALSLVLDQQLALTTPGAVKKEESVESEGPEYIYIPLKGPSDDITSQDVSVGLQHTGELHDSIPVPLLTNLEQEEPAVESKIHSQLYLKAKTTNDDEIMWTSPPLPKQKSKTAGETALNPSQDSKTSDGNVPEGVVSPRTLKDQKGTVPKALGVVLDQQLAIAAPSGKMKEDKEKNVGSDEPKYIHIPLKDPSQPSTSKQEDLISTVVESQRDTVNCLEDGSETTEKQPNQNQKHTVEKPAKSAPLGQKQEIISPLIHSKLEKGVARESSQAEKLQGAMVLPISLDQRKHPKSPSSATSAFDTEKTTKEKDTAGSKVSQQALGVKDTDDINTGIQGLCATSLVYKQHLHDTNLGYQKEPTPRSSTIKNTGEDLEGTRSPDDVAKQTVVEVTKASGTEKGKSPIVSSTEHIEKLHDALVSPASANQEKHLKSPSALLGLQFPELQTYSAQIADKSLEDSSVPDYKVNQNHLERVEEDKKANHLAADISSVIVVATKAQEISDNLVLPYPISQEHSQIHDIKKISKEKDSPQEDKGHHLETEDKGWLVPVTDFQMHSTENIEKDLHEDASEERASQDFKDIKTDKEVHFGTEVKPPVTASPVHINTVLPASISQSDHSKTPSPAQQPALGKPTFGLQLHLTPTPTPSLEKSTDVSPDLRDSVNETESPITSREDRAIQSESPPLVIQTTQIADSSMPVAVQLNQAPAGAEVLTSPTPDDAGASVDAIDGGARAQAPPKGASTKVGAAKNSAHFQISMEGSKRKNATTREKNMEDVAATKIQASFRGYQVRKQLKSKNGGVESIIQKRSLRRKSSGKLRGAEKASQKPSSKPSDLEEKSATKIQAGVRGFLVRRRQKKAKGSTTPESS